MRLSTFAMSCLVAWSIPACVAEAPEAEQQGTLQLPIVSTSASGRQYRLTGTLNISGPQAATVALGGDSPTVSVPLRVGSYTATLAPGWQVERLQSGMGSNVQATLSTMTPVSFAIQQNTSTPMALTFQVQGDAVVFATGTLDISVNITDQAFETSCSDGVDNDTDGLVDCSDPECSGSSSCTAVAEICTNMIDDDADGKVDCLDPDCAMNAACHVPACGDGLAQSGEYCFSIGASVMLPLPAPVNYLSTGDFDGDGKTDLVAASSSPPGVVVVLNRGATYQVGPMFNPGGVILGIAATKLDGDAKTDLVIANNGLSQVRGLVVDQVTGAVSNLGMFQSPLGNVRRIAVADFDLDGKSDVAAASDTQLVMLRNTGNSFAPSGSVPLPGPAQAIAILDINGDMRPDLAVSRQMAPELRTFFTDAAGSPSPAGTIIVPTGDAAALGAGDFNGDGKPDLVVGSSIGSTGATLFNLGGTLSLGPTMPLGNLSTLVVAKLNIDSNLDIVGGSSQAPSRYMTALGDPMGGFALKDELPGNSPAAVAAVDLTGDGFNDIVLSRGNLLEIRNSNP